MTEALTFTPLAALGHYTERSDDEMRARARAFLDLARSRHSVREFAPDPAPLEAVEDCIRAAGLAPSGANRQPWSFVLIVDPEMKRRLRAAAEAEERAFYAGRAPQEWIDALGPLGTDAEKPFLETAPCLIAVFAQRRGGLGPDDDGKNYYVNESVGIAVGFLLLALHYAGFATLTHTPNPMGFLSEALGRPANEKPYMIIVAGRPAADARVPDHALRKKPLEQILSVI